jgi:hypothetical protein
MFRGIARYFRRHHVALLALFVALGGTSYAAASRLLPPNSVGSPQVINGSLQTKDLSKKARTALRGNRGLRGLAGAPGAPGATGAQGAQGIQGPIGPSDAYEAVFCSELFCSGNTNPPYEITEATLETAPFFVTIPSLPAGDYTVGGQITILAAAGSSDWDVFCQLRVPLSGAGWVGGAAATVGEAGGDGFEVSLPIVFGARVPSAGSSLGLKCARAGGTGGNPSVIYADFIATKVGTLHQ